MIPKTVSSSLKHRKLTHSHTHTHTKTTLVYNTSDNHSCFSFPFPREEDDPSHCAVPISTSLIKQIATKIHPGGTVTQILDEFYGPEKFLQPTWPYNKKDSDR